MSSAMTDSDASSPASLLSLLHTPLTFVESQLSAAVATASAASPDPITLQTTLAHQNWGIEDEVHRLLGLKEKRGSVGHKLSLVPSLNELNASRDISHLKPNQLVRFRGMVQETFQPDYFLGMWNTSNNGTTAASASAFRTGKYRDTLDVESHAAANSRASNAVTLERLSINVVPIPGETEWVSRASKKMESGTGLVAPQPPSVATGAAAVASAGSAKKKRQLDESSAEEQKDQAMEDTEDSSNQSHNTPAKKAKDDTTNVTSPAATTSSSSFSLTSEAQGNASASPAATSSMVDHASAARDYGLEVIVTLYDDLAVADGEKSRSPKVSQCYEFIGVLSLDPALALLDQESAEEAVEMGAEMWGARRSRAIRMHALTMVPVEESFPYVADPARDAALFKTQRSEMDQVKEGVRTSLVQFLTQLTAGDELAAELLLLFLLQRIHTRGVGVAGLNMIGKLSLNFIAPALPAGSEPSQYGSFLQRGLSMLLPRVGKLDLNVAELNRQLWQPKKNYEEDSLDSNKLHYSSATCLLLDETHLSTGTLDGTGITNLRVLSKVLQTSQLEYDFQYSTLPFAVDWAVLLLSAGGRSLLQQEGNNSGIDIFFKLNAAPALHSTAPPCLSTAVPTEQQLDYWRAFLLLGRQSEFQIHPDRSKNIEDAFVKLRQMRPKETSESTLHLLLNLARLLCLSHLESELSIERWDQVLALYEKIYQRS